MVDCRLQTPGSRNIHVHGVCDSTQAHSTQYTSTQYTSTQYTSTQYTSTQYTSTQYTSTQYTSTQCQKRTKNCTIFARKLFRPSTLCLCILLADNQEIVVYGSLLYTQSLRVRCWGGGGLVLVGSRVLLELRVTWFTTTSSTVTLMNWLFTVQLPQLLSA